MGDVLPEPTLYPLGRTSESPLEPDVAIQLPGVQGTG